MTDKDDALEKENGRLRRLLEQAGIDAAASDVTSKLQKLLISELHHRVKNLLAMVLSITAQTLRHAPSLEVAQEAIQGRIMILARSFDLLIEEEVDALSLKAIIENAAEPYNETRRIAISVPPMRVAALPALTIALVLNELCTNALKHGALAHPDGSVTVTGAREGDLVSLIWAEKDGPPVKPPSSQGYGTTLIRTVIPEATVDLDFPATGVVCRIRMPRASLGHEISN